MTACSGARRLLLLCLAQLYGAAVPAPRLCAQTSTPAHAESTQQATTHATTQIRESKPKPVIPRTPAGDALRAWIVAFNSADTMRICAYPRQYEPDVVLGDERGFREQTGGFDLRAIERSTSRHIEYIVRERKSPMTAYGVLDVSGVAPIRVTARRMQPLGPNVSAAATRLDGATRTRTVATVAALLNTFYVSRRSRRARPTGSPSRAYAARTAFMEMGSPSRCGSTMTWPS